MTGSNPISALLGGSDRFVMIGSDYRGLFDLNDRVAVITGGSGFLGREFASALAQHGAHVALLDIDGDGAAACCRELAEQFGVKTLAVVADLSVPESIRSAVDRICDQFGGIDILLNNAQSKIPDRAAYFAPFEEYDLKEWRRVLSVDLDGMAFMAQHVCRSMAKRESGGSLIHVGSIYGAFGPDNRIYQGAEYQGTAINNPAVYSVAKAGVLGLTRWLATTYAKQGIRSNAIIPGGVESGQNPAFVARYSDRVPMGRMARRQEIAGAALWLASNASSYVTGQAIFVDGGLSAW